MFGSCEQGQAYVRAVDEWMDRMSEKATALQAILSGVADGTREIQAKAESTDSEWASAFRKVKDGIQNGAPARNAAGAGGGA